MILDGRLMVRKLKETKKYAWYGFEVYRPKLLMDQKDVADEVYKIPFAMKLSLQTGEVLESHIPAKMDRTQRQKLLALYYALSTYELPFIMPYIGKHQVAERDHLGEKSTEYSRDLLGAYHKKVLAYTSLDHKGGAQGFTDPKDLKIHENTLDYSKDSCWLTNFAARSNIAMKSRWGIQINTSTELVGRLIDKPIPQDSLLKKLGNNPLAWPKFTLDVPKLEEEQRVNVMAFQRKLEEFSHARKTQNLVKLLRGNANYYDQLRRDLAGGLLEDAVSQRVFLALGKVDTKESHSLLASVISDEEVGSKEKFRALMALRYTKNAIEPETLGNLFEYVDSAHEGDEKDAADSLLLVMGVVAGATEDPATAAALEHKIEDRLNRSQSSNDKRMLLAAVGNTRSPKIYQTAKPFVRDEDPHVRASALLSVGRAPGSDESTTLLLKALQEDQNHGVKSAALQSLSKQSLDKEALAIVKGFTSATFPPSVRSAAINAYAIGRKDKPQVDEFLKELLKGETNRQVIKSIMSNLYTS